MFMSSFFPRGKTPFEMPATRNRKLHYGKNPFAVPEPYFLPGYTGHCPGYSEAIGQTYGHATHALMEDVSPLRLQQLPTDADQWMQQMVEKPLQPEDLDLLRERKTREAPLLKEDIAPGYKGYVPRARQMVGLNFNRSCVRGVAQFERRRRELQEKLRAKTRIEDWH